MTSSVTTGTRSFRFGAVLVTFALALGACSIGASSDEADAASSDAERAVAPGDGLDIDDGHTEVTEPPAQDTSTTAVTEPDLPENSPGTVNELEDLIENDTGEMESTPDNSDLIERLITFLLADDGGVEIGVSDARCVATLLDEGLSETSFELLVTNLETLNEIEDGNQFTDAELTVISESFANCVDFRDLVDEVVDDDVQLGSLVSCLSNEIGVDGVEALLLFEVLGENADRLVTPVFVVGLDLCPEDARAAIDSAILDQFLLADAPVVEACLAGITDDELRPFFETREFGELINVIREDCLF